MSDSDEKLLDAVIEKLKRNIPISREDWQIWWPFVLNSKYVVSSCNNEEFAGMQAQLQQGVRKVFLGGNQ